MKQLEESRERCLAESNELRGKLDEMRISQQEEAHAHELAMEAEVNSRRQAEMLAQEKDKAVEALTAQLSAIQAEGAIVAQTEIRVLRGKLDAQSKVMAEQAEALRVDTSHRADLESRLADLQLELDEKAHAVSELQGKLMQLPESGAGERAALATVLEMRVAELELALEGKSEAISELQSRLDAGESGAEEGPRARELEQLLGAERESLRQLQGKLEAEEQRSNRWETEASNQRERADAASEIRHELAVQLRVNRELEGKLKAEESEAHTVSARLELVDELESRVSELECDLDDRAAAIAELEGRLRAQQEVSAAWSTQAEAAARLETRVAELEQQLKISELRRGV